MMSARLGDAVESHVDLLIGETDMTFQNPTVKTVRGFRAREPTASPAPLPSLYRFPD